MPLTRTTRLALIGFGAIGRAITAALVQSPPPGHQLVALLVRPHQLADARAAVPASVQVTSDMAALLASAPQTVIKAAGHG
ncbi:MAG TPA: hypothetical protein PK306_29900, partial [Aquabacterium sp.]|nr:hypothetical protein [Aquabacterium sp.]